ncbi:MAG: exodeoxyribonuclease III [Candidatus Dormibacteraeota bacterium]|nr:exodeoxyribonuclease III [Candidatus Dormibacteraeota bacterium]
MLIATWNVNSIQARLPLVLEWLGRRQPDVLLIQETKCPPGAFPRSEVEAAGYQVADHGEGRWNGVAVLSRVGLEQVATGLELDAPDGRVEARYLAADCGALRVASVYVPNGRELGHPYFTYKLAFLEDLRERVAMELAGGRAFVIGGDFNIAPRDSDVFDPAAFVGQTHVSREERDALTAVLGAGVVDLADLPGQTPSFTYWDYRQGFFRRGLGMRIDLLLGSQEVAAATTLVEVDRSARGAPRPSDHAPLMASLAGL